MPRAYDVRRSDRGHEVSDTGLLLITATLVVGVWHGVQLPGVPDDPMGSGAA